jgi:hypothetical protein
MNAIFCDLCPSVSNLYQISIIPFRPNLAIRRRQAKSNPARIGGISETRGSETENKKDSKISTNYHQCVSSVPSECPIIFEIAVSITHSKLI